MNADHHAPRDDTTVWIFHGAHAPHAAAVFRTRDDGLVWAVQHRVTGILAEYPLGEGCYDHAVRTGRFRPHKPHHGTAGHVAQFSPGLDHVHLTDGTPDLDGGPEQYR